MLNSLKYNAAELLESSEHAALMPDSLSGMSQQGIEALFGEHTINRYLEDKIRREAEAYRGDARRILLRVRRADFLLSQMQNEIDKLTARGVSIRTEEQGIISSSDLKNVQNNLSDNFLPSYFIGIYDCCINTISSGESNLGVDAAAILKKLSVYSNELSEHARFFLKNRDDQLLLNLFEIEGSNKAPLEGDTISRNVVRAQQIADTGCFGTEDIIRETIGGRAFAKVLKKHFYNAAKNNRSIRGEAYREFYIRFGTKHFKRFVDQTLGTVLFSFKNEKKPEDWTKQDVLALEKHVFSRYQLVHDVIEGLANKNTNPLGTNLSKEQTFALMGETLKSAIYPKYRINIRVGIGGTQHEDVLIRVGAYIMNALDTIGVYKAANEVCSSVEGINAPTLTLVSGAALAERVNGLDPALGRKNEQNIFGFLDKFAAAYYPEMRGLIAYSSPSQEEVFENDLYVTLFAAAKEIAEHKQTKDQEWSETYEKKCKAAAALSTLTNFASKRKASNNNEDAAKHMAIQYAVAHVTPPVFQSICSKNRYAAPVWKIGGRSEKHFNAFGEALVDLLQDDERFSLPNRDYACSLLAGICTTTTVGGNPPPYYRGPKGSLDLGLVETGKKIVNGTISDDDVISRVQSEDSGPASDLRALLSHHRLGCGDVARGWGKYKAFLAQCTQ